MKVLIIGGGGREHALAWAAEKSPVVEGIICLTPNAGIRQLRKFMPMELSKLPETQAELVDFARRTQVGLVIVGPEKPLADGIVDVFQEAKIPTFGPTQAAAVLESSKSEAKLIMRCASVPTAQAVEFTKDQLPEALGYAGRATLPFVTKAYGLAEGKGVTVCYRREQAEGAIRECFVQDKFGPSGHRLLIENFLVGHPGLPRAELSILALVDIHGNFVMFPAAQDYKPVFDNDQGPNTGGMGSYAPIPWVTEEMMAIIGQKIFVPVIQEMKFRGIPFSGVLYAGLMWTTEGPKVVEFNVRFGDPELQPLISLLETDLIPVLQTIATGGSIKDVKLKFKKASAVCEVMASRGYPGKYKKGFPIQGLERVSLVNGIDVYHAGTKLDGRTVLTNGGRVLGLTVTAENLATAAHFAFNAVSNISWGDSDNSPYFRTDIGRDVPTSVAV